MYYYHSCLSVIAVCKPKAWIDLDSKCSEDDINLPADSDVILGECQTCTVALKLLAMNYCFKNQPIWWYFSSKI